MRSAVLGELSQAALVSLVEAGDLKETRPGQFIWSGNVYQAGRRPSRPDFETRKVRPRRTPLQSVLDLLETPGDRALARAAASRFAGDMERAAYGQRVTQNWDTSLHVDGVSSGGKDAGRMLSAQAASRRLGQVAGVLSANDFRSLTLLIIEERSLATMAVLGDVSVRNMRIQLCNALLELVRAYRLHVSSEGGL